MIDYTQASKDVFAIEAVPRLGFSSHHTLVQEALIPLGIRCVLSQGVDWGKGLTTLIEQNLRHKYLLTLDYDSFFTVYDVARLYALMEEHPEIDALCPIAMCRYPILKPAFTQADENGNRVEKISREELEAPLLEIVCGHFNLAIFRAEALQELPKPWFWSQPDDDGRWGEKSLAQEQYFWRNWHRSGRTIYQANHVVIGHLDTVVLWPGNNLQPFLQFENEYLQVGKPPEAVNFGKLKPVWPPEQINQESQPAPQEVPS